MRAALHSLSRHDRVARRHRISVVKSLNFPGERATCGRRRVRRPVDTPTRNLFQPRERTRMVSSFSFYRRDVATSSFVSAIAETNDLQLGLLLEPAEPADRLVPPRRPRRRRTGPRVFPSVDDTSIPRILARPRASQASQASQASRGLTQVFRATGRVISRL